MARIGQLFGGRSHHAVDRDHDGVDDRAERTDRLEATEGTVDRDRDGVDDRVERTDRTHRIPAVGVPDQDTDRNGIIDRGEAPTSTMSPVIDREPVVEAPVRPTPARASLLATLGVIVGLVGVAAALTGLLATWAIPLGALGLLLSFGGVISGARPHVAGRGLGSLGLLISATAVVFGILAITGTFSWLDSDVDQVAKLNAWLDEQLPWMRDW